MNRRTVKLTRYVQGVLGALTVIALAFTAQHAHSTLATWNDQEWVGTPPESIRTLDCVDPIPEQQVATRAEGQFLSGTALGLDTADVASIAGVSVTNNSTRALVRPDDATAVDGRTDAYRNPLAVSLLQAELPNLAPTLQLPLNTSTGALSQFAQASSTGQTHAASGAITNAGGLRLTAVSPNDPDIASVSLSKLLDTVGLNLKELVSGVADAQLSVGALASRAELAGCDYLWSDGKTVSPSRDYLAAGLDMQVSFSEDFQTFTEAAAALIEDLDTVTLNLTDSTPVKNSITSTISGLLNGVITSTQALLGLALGTPTVETLTASVDLDALIPINALLTETIADPNGVVSINLSDGMVTINTAALLGEAGVGNMGNTLNSLPPNFDLLSNLTVVNKLTEIVTGTLSVFLDRLTGLLQPAVNAIAVETVIVIPITLLGIQVSSTKVTVRGTLAELLNGQGEVTTAPGAQSSGLLSAVVNALANILVSITNTLVTNLALRTGVGNAINNVLSPFRSPTQITQVVNLTVTTISTLYSTLFLGQLVSVTVNAQNDPATGQPEPTDWSGLPAGSFDVSAMRIGVLNQAQQRAIAIYLGRSSVGPVCSARASPLDCTGY